MAHVEYDKYGIIDRVIKDLRLVRVRVEDMSTEGVQIVDCIKALEILKAGLQEDDKESKEGNDAANLEK